MRTPSFYLRSTLPEFPISNMSSPPAGAPDHEAAPSIPHTPQPSCFNVRTAPASTENTATVFHQPPTVPQDVSHSRSASPFATPAPPGNSVAQPNLAVVRSTSSRANAATLQRRTPATLPPKAPLSKRKKGQSGRRGNGFSQGETENFLELLQEFLPLGKDEWKKVARLHETRYPSQKRNADSLRRKFSALCRTTVPTGDPTIPPDVLKAKEIREEMTERADIGDAAESDDEYTEDLNDETALLHSMSVEETGSEAGAVVIPGDNRVSPGAIPNNAPSATPSPRPLVRKKSSTTAKQDDDSVVGALKMSMMQEQMRRDEEHRQRMMDREDERLRREEERRLREEQRNEERERREDERRRSDRMMELMMVALIGKRGGEAVNSAVREMDK